MPSSASPLVPAWPFYHLVHGRGNPGGKGKANGKLPAPGAIARLAAEAAAIALLVVCAGAAHGAMAPSWGAAKITIGSNGDSLFPMAGAAESRTAEDADAGDVLRAIAANGVAATMAATNAVPPSKDEGQGTEDQGQSRAGDAREGQRTEEGQGSDGGAQGVQPSCRRSPSDCATPPLSQDNENSKQTGTK